MLTLPAPPPISAAAVLDLGVSVLGPSPAATGAHKPELPTPSVACLPHPLRCHHHMGIFAGLSPRRRWNCNHFTTDVYNHFTGKPTPRWVNRLARLALCSIRNSVLTENIKVSVVRGETAHLEFSAENHNHQHAAQAMGGGGMVAHIR
ncbi:deSI-like protein At4g17486 [Triticum urartu]|uniref:deSI-like protein At4g17486 n=1 Tax=Triticum urartu TaxID=4572 RepID=UPI0020439ACF|nr:deSI-like protein At4g17486 [Triticum urartu]